MDKKIERLLEDYCIKKGFTKWKNDNELLEVLRNCNEVYRDSGDKHRHWVEYQYVVKIKDTYIGYIYAETTGDMNPSEVGYEFDPDSICEMEAVEKTITTYVKKVKGGN